MQTVPIKFSDQLYAQLKKASKATNTSMADLLREAVKPKLNRILKNLERKQAEPFNIIEWMYQNASKGKDVDPNLTDDEIIYGVDLSQISKGDSLRHISIPKKTSLTQLRSQCQ